MMAFVIVQSVVSDSVSPWTAACQAPNCPSLSPRICSNSCPLTWWFQPSISSSVTSFSSCPQSFPARWLFLLRKSKTPDATRLPNSSFLWECGTKCLEDNNFDVITIINTIAVNIISRASSTASRISRTSVLGFAYMLSELLGTLYTLTHLTSHNSPMK